jgi:hypothetical protein
VNKWICLFSCAFMFTTFPVVVDASAEPFSLISDDNYESVIMEEGSSKSLSFSLSGEGENVQVYVSDLITKQNGGWEIKSPDDFMVSRALWVSGDRMVIEKLSGKRYLRYTVKTPEKLESGEYGFSLVATDGEHTSVSKVMLNVGDKPEILPPLELMDSKFSDIAGEEKRLQLTFFNSSTFTQTPVMEYALYDESGKTVLTETHSFEEVYEHSTVSATIGLPNSLVDGTLYRLDISQSGMIQSTTFEVSANYVQKVKEEKTKTIAIVFVAVCLVVFAIGFLIIWKGRRRNGGNRAAQVLNGQVGR